MVKAEQIIGRAAEKQLLDTVLASKDPELITVFGRRRVGKTYLIREYLKRNLVLEVAGIADVQTQLASWRYTPKPGSDEEGAQIDLLLDRADRCINICEIKYSSSPYVVTKSYAEEFRRKLRVFNQRSGRKQTLFLTMITPEGIKPNRYTEELVTNQVLLNDLFALKCCRPFSST